MFSTKLRPLFERILRDRSDALSRRIWELKVDLKAWRIQPHSILDPRPELRTAVKEIDAVHDALRRLEGGSFGYCLDCARDIDPELLQQEPTRIRCGRDDCRALPRTRRNPQPLGR